MAKKTTTLKYTLQEIIIVIIGITIAFSMNKCADNARDNSLKEEYLINLKSDVENDKIQLEINKKDIEKKLKICNALIPTLNTGQKHGMPLMNDTFELVQYTTFSPKNTTFKTLINSGDLKLIEDFKLKTNIQGHYTNYEKLDDVYARHRSLIKDYLGNYMIIEADYDQLFEDKTPFKNEIRLKNIIRALLTTFREKQRITLQAIESCNSLIKDIDKALEL
ncbi:MAG: DUF6090 family protein [Winogradskyella sp.]|uniref:DUF6090 family protein n=1 Tax=Winogradskyella sp. TaxID=1883156 RepID=UPI00385A5700